MTSRHVVRLLAVTAALAACSQKEEGPASDVESAIATTAQAASVAISSPRTGDTVSVPFTVALAATGVEVIPADGTAVEGQGHHHLLIDSALATDTLPIPGAPAAIHMGNGASEFEVKELAPGPHRIITVFAYGNHVPMSMVKRDTIDIVVK